MAGGDNKTLIVVGENANEEHCRRRSRDIIAELGIQVGRVEDAIPED